MRVSRAGGAAVAVLPLLLVGTLVGPAPAYAVERRQDVACAELEDSGTEDSFVTGRASAPLEALGVPALHQRLGGAARAGAGVRVAVVDSGVERTHPLLDVVGGTSFARRPQLLDHHGTAVAGLVAGGPRGGRPTGVAPGAQVVDVRVYDDDVEPDEDGITVQPAEVVQGLRWVADNAARLRIGVVVVALWLDDSPELAEVVRRLHRDEDVVVVASSGNRPTDQADPRAADFGTLVPGEDVAGVVHPAGYETDVVAVNATTAGHPEPEARAADFVLQNSATDVAAPTYDAVSLGLNGSTCLLPDVATSWSAGIVAGLVAVLRARFPREDADQVVARLRQTASGSPDDVNVLVGAGVVQPLDAVSRRLTPDRDGRLGRAAPAESDIPPAEAPAPAADVLGPARHDAVWWGLLGGAVVVLALLLRPLVTRRR